MNPFSSFLQLICRIGRNMAVLAVGTAIVAVMTFTSAGLAGGRNALTAYAETPGQDVPSDQMAEAKEIALLTEAKIQTQLRGSGSLRGGQLLLGNTLADTIHREKELRQEQKAAAEKNKEAARLVREQIARQEQEKKEAKQAFSCTDKDYQVLLRIVEAEAGICDMKGRILVANVIMNRVRSREFPNTVTEVVYQKNQFSPVNDGRLNRVEVTDATIEAVNRALAGEDYSQGALYFMNRRRSQSKNVSWFDGQLTYLFHHDRHEFFR